MSENRDNSPNASVNVTLSGAGAAIISAIVLAVAFACVAWVKAADTFDNLAPRVDKAETETRMLEYYVMELDGKLMAAGLIDYNESWAAQKKAQQAKQKEAKQ